MDYEMGKEAKSCGGKIVRKISFEDNQLTVEFDDCTLTLTNQHSCCESRYFTCDDAYEDYVGLPFLGYRVVEAANVPNEYGEHEVNFLIFMTPLGDFTIAAHNEHNGYYGGMWISEELTPKVIKPPRYAAALRNSTSLISHTREPKKWAWE